jgi:hypothetical protein
MERYFYSDSIAEFVGKAPDKILGELLRHSHFAVDVTQKDAWMFQISLLQEIFTSSASNGVIYLEFSIPRLGKRIDVVLIMGSVIFVLEFKVGEGKFPAYAMDQVWDYSLDLHHFHETSSGRWLVPVLVCTEAPDTEFAIRKNGNILDPVCCNARSLANIINTLSAELSGPALNAEEWERGRYLPTPTIVEAAKALYAGHSVEEIARNDAEASNLGVTSTTVEEIILSSKTRNEKAICFVTGVPGAGKTLVGLNIATKHMDEKNELYSVFLSGNGPLVAVLREALALDRVERTAISKGEARSQVKAFIQNVHHFRDDCLMDSMRPPIEHVAIFDEAQRAWNREMTSRFMQTKRKKTGFQMSEPEFLISCLDRHPDWAVVVCLVGGGQEINTGEAGISEWIKAIYGAFPKWRIYMSARLADSEYQADEMRPLLQSHPNVLEKSELHLSVSLRSFRSEKVSFLIKTLLDLEEEQAADCLKEVASKFPMLITRNLNEAKSWLRGKARGSERYGILASSRGERLKPHAIDVRVPVDPVHWFLKNKDDVRSSYYLEDVATEFHVQGLELDWTCVTWDADLRFSKEGWQYWSFKGNRWEQVRKTERQSYAKNAYRVLLTRARQGMVIFVPEGDRNDPTRKPEYYDPTYEYLRTIGFQSV